MTYSLFYLTNIFWLLTLSFIIYCVIYLKYIGGFSEIFWKCVYVGGAMFITFFYLFLDSEVILMNFLKRIEESVIIKDLQDIVNLSLDLSYLLTIYLILPIIFFFIWNYAIGLWNKAKIISWKYYLYLFIYFLIIFKFYLDFDLFLSSWNFFNKQLKYDFDFQPDFSYIIFSYFGDYYDFLSIFIFLLISFCLCNTLNLNLLNFLTLKYFFFSKLIFFCITTLFFIYFFGGENLLRDIFILCFNFYIIELYYFTYLFFFNIKRKKI